MRGRGGSRPAGLGSQRLYLGEPAALGVNATRARGFASDFVFSRFELQCGVVSGRGAEKIMLPRGGGEEGKKDCGRHGRRPRVGIPAAEELAWMPARGRGGRHPLRQRLTWVGAFVLRARWRDRAKAAPDRLG